MPGRAPGHSLTPVPGTSAEAGPRLGGSQHASDALGQVRSGLCRRSGPPRGSPLPLLVSLPRGVVQDNRRSFGPSGADGSGVRHLRLRSHAPLVAF
ncbi:hypothetical protein NDU88_000976 [Pleurodeles waltl]|uniref:Uncharacterized protein n=1 Tax=Pleurodeles waltl TaxID=8319 RepID=A0AAV7U739_PLEWA|nr:hypothetical protein NDU88_000976 [Pleurodeles waltl]